MVFYRRWRVVGGTYFFTVTLQDRQSQILTQHIRLLQESWKLVQQRHPFKTLAYVILPDHFHMIWRLPDNNQDYATRIRLLKTIFTQKITRQCDYFVKNNRGEYNIWQKRYWEHMIRNDKDYENHVNYIHYNPIKHKLASRTRDWPYSSFLKFVNQGIYPLDWSDGVYRNDLKYNAE